MFPQIKNPQAWRRRGQFKEKLGEDNLSCNPTSRQLRHCADCAHFEYSFNRARCLLLKRAKTPLFPACLQFEEVANDAS